MAVSKRLRYEILKRDNHACRYCGGTAPDVALTVDHVIPVALGGSDQPDNLVAACEDCNAGKSSVPADAPLVADVAADALRWSKAMERAADVVAADRQRRVDDQSVFLSMWEDWTFKVGGRLNQIWPLPGDWTSSIDSMMAAGAVWADLREAVNIALGKRGISDRWPYFCGVVWKLISRKQEIARQILHADQSEGDGC